MYIQCKIQLANTHLVYKSIISSEANPQGCVLLPLYISNCLCLVSVEKPRLNSFKTYLTPGQEVHNSRQLSHCFVFLSMTLNLNSASLHPYIYI